MLKALNLATRYSQMLTNADLSGALIKLVQDIEPPPVPLLQIRRKMTQQSTLRPRGHSYGTGGAAAAAALLVLGMAFPSYSSTLIQTVEARYRAALQALGGIAPPPVPKTTLNALTARSATLETAQRRVPFTIVPPSGLPSDIRSETITTAPSGIYSKKTHQWRVGPQDVTFAYHRAGGRTFLLRAGLYDARGEIPGKWMFEALAPGTDGKPVLVKHRKFVWRNGKQVTTAVEGPGISAAEIEAIRTAMHGQAMPLRDLHAPDTGSSYAVHIIPPP